MKYLLENYGVRAYQGYDDYARDISVTSANQGHYHFSNLLLPLLLTIKDTEVLNFIMRSENLSLTH